MNVTARRRVSEEGRNLIDSSRESRHIAGDSTRTDSEMTIRIGIWTELSTNTRWDTNCRCFIRSQANVF